MEAPKVKMQHYVPRLYLRRFTFDKRESKVRVFNKENGKTFEPNIENILCETYFYDTDADVHQKVEAALGVIESDFNSAYEAILETEDLDALDDKSRFIVAVYIALQEHRTPVFRKKYAEMVRKMKERVTLMMTGTATPEALERLGQQHDDALKEDAIKAAHIGTMMDTPRFAEIMMAMKWILIKNPTQVPFWTSDQPVTRFNPIDHGVYGNMGLASRGIMVHFPLSPDLCLRLCDPEMYAKAADRLTCVEVSNVDYINQWQVHNAMRFLISNKLGFKLAEIMLRDHPELANPDRDRVQVQ